MSCVTVFGGTGFVGRRVVRHLCETGATVRVASRHPRRVEGGDVKQIAPSAAITAISGASPITRAEDCTVVRSPVEICLGTSPSQAAKSRPGKIKRFKRIAFRCEKTAPNYRPFIALACGFILIKSVHRT